MNTGIDGLFEFETLGWKILNRYFLPILFLHSVLL